MVKGQHERPEFDSSQKQDFYHLQSSQCGSGTHQDYYRGGGVSSELKRQEHEADNFSPSSAEVKNGGAVPSLPYTSSLRKKKI
jgi:hypothetical protein